MIEGYKTIGEVAKETGLSVREIKYYSERKIVSPSKEYYQGNKKYNLYSDVDIIKIQQIALYRELGYSKDQIKEIISNPDFNWNDALDSQIAELRVLKKHIDNKIIAAEFIRFIFQQEKIKDFDISDFDNNIDSFATNLTEFFSPEAEEKTNDSLMNVTSDILNNISIESYEEIGETVIETYKKLTTLMNKNPKDDIVQSEFINIKNKLLDAFAKTNILDSEFSNSESLTILFVLRIISTISIERAIDMFFQKENALNFIVEMIEEYISRTEKENENG